MFACPTKVILLFTEDWRRGEMLEKNLNLGSGNNAVPGFINIDYSPNVILSKFQFLKKILGKVGVIKAEHMKEWDKSIIFMDGRRLKFKIEEFDNIYSSHFLEHIFMWEAQNVVEKCFKLLKPGGMIRLALPDYYQIAKNFVDGYANFPSQKSIEFDRALLSHPLTKSEKLSFLVNAKFGHIHKWHPTEGSVRMMLKTAGFQEINSRSYQVGKFPYLDLVENRPIDTFYIEARKPLQG